MTLELRVLGGARRGSLLRSDKPVVVLGRQPGCDLQLDPDSDLDVSARHAEVHRVGTSYLVRDLGSTNGTLVNGVRVSGDRALRDGDMIGLGPSGPTVQFRQVSLVARRRGVLVAATLLTMGLAVPLSMFWRTRAARSTPAPAPMLAGDTIPSEGSTNDFRAAFAASSDAIAYVVTELEGRSYGGTAFGVREDGLLVTNRHLLVRGRAQATRVRVQFANTLAWHDARLERLARDPADDVALIRIDTSGMGAIPIVVGLDTVAPASGTPVASIGFPLADGMPMDSIEHRAVARASLISGMVSRSLSRLLQIESFAAHGSSGSPIVNREGRVLGVIYGGPAQANGRIVWAVPGRVVVELIEGR